MLRWSLYRIKPFEVVVATIEDVERVLLVWDCVHRIDIVHSGFGYVEERRNRCLNVIQRMNLDSSLSMILPVDGPFECIQAKFYRS